MTRVWKILALVLPLLIAGCLQSGSTSSSSGGVNRFNKSAGEGSPGPKGDGVGYGILSRATAVAMTAGTSRLIPFQFEQSSDTPQVTVIEPFKQVRMDLLPGGFLVHADENTVGIDQLTYNVTQAGEVTSYTQLLDIRPFCFRNQAEKNRPNLHVISASNAGPMNQIHVHLRAQREPIELVLFSRYWASWRIKRDPGVKIARVVVGLASLINYKSPSEIKGLLPNEQVTFVRGSEFPLPDFEWQPTIGRTHFGKMIDYVRKTFDGNETSFTGCQVLERVEIAGPHSVTAQCGDEIAKWDPTREIAVHPKASQYYFADQKCEKRCDSNGVFAQNVWSEVDRTPNILLFDPFTVGIAAGVSTRPGLVRGSVGPRCGKHYFEAKVEKTEGDINARIGVTSFTTSVDIMAQVPGLMNAKNVTYHATHFKPGDHVSVWFDLDSLQATIKKSSTNGEEVVTHSQMEFWLHDAVFPMALMGSPKTRVRANFGAEPFALE